MLIPALIGLAPNASEIGNNYMDRYKHLHQMMLNAPYVPAGEKVTTASARDFIEKRAALQGNPIPIAPGVLKRAMPNQPPQQPRAVRPPKFEDTMLGHVIGKGSLIGGPLLGLDQLTAPVLGQMGQALRNRIFSPFDRANMVEEGASSFAKSVGSALGTSVVGLLGDLLSKTVHAPSQMMQNRAQQSVFETLRKKDEVLSQADPQQLLESYHTMARFAPTLATDMNAVKTFLRESVLYGSGPNVISIKQLVDAEHAINPPPKV